MAAQQKKQYFPSLLNPPPSNSMPSPRKLSETKFCQRQVKNIPKENRIKQTDSNNQQTCIGYVFPNVSLKFSSEVSCHFSVHMNSLLIFDRVCFYPLTSRFVTFTINISTNRIGRRGACFGELWHTVSCTPFHGVRHPQSQGPMALCGSHSESL